MENYLYTQNREFSWLRFNQRVLEEAADPTLPPLERLKFVSIFSSNLDEFFMVRSGSLFDIAAMEPNQVDNKSGLTPQQQLVGIYQMTAALVGQKEQVYREVCRSLEVQGIADVPFSALSKQEADFARGVFRDQILPVLSPQIVDSRHPTPHFGNKQLYIASLVKSKHDKSSMAFTPVPEVLPKVVMLPGSTRFIRTENLILHFASALYGNYTPVESCIFAVTRNADVQFDSDKFEDAEEDYRIHVKKLLKKRRSLAILRLELNAPVSPSFRKELLKFIPVEEHQIYTDTTPLQMGYVFGLLKLLPQSAAQALSYPPHTPQWPEGLSREASMISQILQKDRCLFFPFHCVDPFIRLLNEAADDPQVVSVKITIYRLASSSKIVRALCHAAEKGKEVVVLMELRARFDEENNIAWSEMLEEAGCKVIYGMENYKCHSKICLITRQKKGKFQYITQIGTGNYNEKTNAMYTDLSLMTADPEIGADATAFFQNMLVGNVEGSYRRLLVAPNGIRQTLFALIDREIAKGDRGYICIKVNSITHRGMIDKLAPRDSGPHPEHLRHQHCGTVPGARPDLLLRKRGRAGVLHLLRRPHDPEPVPPGGDCLPGDRPGHPPGSGVYSAHPALRHRQGKSVAARRHLPAEKRPASHRQPGPILPDPLPSGKACGSRQAPGTSGTASPAENRLLLILFSHWCILLGKNPREMK